MLITDVDDFIHTPIGSLVIAIDAVARNDDEAFELLERLLNAQSSGAELQSEAMRECVGLNTQ